MALHLPVPQPSYSQTDEAQMRRILELEDKKNRKIATNAGAGDIGGVIRCSVFWGKTLDAGELLDVWNLPETGKWLPTLWIWTAETAPAADKAITLTNEGVAFMTVTFAAGTNDGVVVLTGAVAFAKGNKVTFHAPAAADANLADVAGTIIGTITG
jgi:hypothetical protein